MTLIWVCLGSTTQSWPKGTSTWERIRSAAEKKGSLGRGRSGTSAQSFVLCVFLCSEVIFSCKSHRNFFQKLPLQCRHFLEKPLAKKPQNAAADKGKDPVYLNWRDPQRFIRRQHAINSIINDLVVMTIASSCLWWMQQDLKSKSMPSGVVSHESALFWLATEFGQGLLVVRWTWIMSSTVNDDWSDMRHHQGIAKEQYEGFIQSLA